MAKVIFALCALTSILCAFLLLRGYCRQKARLLLWSGLCFLGLAANNALLVIDRLTGPSLDLSTIRLIPAVVGIMLLIYGLIIESK